MHAAAKDASRNVDGALMDAAAERGRPEEWQRAKEEGFACVWVVPNPLEQSPSVKQECENVGN